jgi:hypothetical protein
MKSEDEPITPDEFVIRLIWHEFLRLGETVAVQAVAFKPRDNESDGISVFRLACLSDPTDALQAISTDKRGKYALALLKVEDLKKLSLSVVPAKIDSVPGHAVIPELNCHAVKQNRAFWKSTQLDLAALASQNFTLPREHEC